MSITGRTRLGLAYVLIATAIWATIGITIRSVEADDATVIVWRGLSGGLSMSLFLLCRHRRESARALRRMGWPGVGVVIASITGTMLYVFAIRRSTIAEVSVIYATVPVCAAAIGWLWLREPTSLRALIAAVFAVGGVAVIVQATPDPTRLDGDLLALVMTGAYAAMIVVLRRYPNRPMLPAVAIAALGSAAIALPFACPSATRPGDALLLVVCGVVQTALGDALFTRGSQIISASRTSFIVTLDAPLASFFSWIVLAEMPGQSAILGGTVVLLAVVGHVLWGERQGVMT